MTVEPWVPLYSEEIPQMLSAAMRPCLFAGPPAHQRALARDGVHDLHRVADSVDVRVRGAHVAVDLYRALHAELQARRLGEVRLRHDAHAQHHKAALDGLVVLHVHDYAVFRLLIALHRVLEAQIEPLCCAGARAVRRPCPSPGAAAPARCAAEA